MIQVVLETDTGPVNFRVHKALLTRHSKWFRDELAEHQSQFGNKIKLKDVDPGTFVMFVEWLYKQELVCINPRFPSARRSDYIFPLCLFTVCLLIMRVTIETRGPLGARLRIYTDIWIRP